MSKDLLLFSKGVRKIKNLHVFCYEFNIVQGIYTNSNQYDIAGWGYKTTSLFARNEARKREVGYVSLEDGFLRSIGLGVAGTQPLSLVVDDVGIYYDARQPSKLEELIIESDTLGSAELKRARLCIDAIRQFRLSKYNQNQSDRSLREEKPKVLVIDQTVGDASVVGAMATQETFVTMLQQALQDNPNETVWVKVHPDVLHGKKKGFLFPLPFEHPNVKLYAEPVNPWDFLDTITHVYTVSSLMGFEALMAGAQVHCFGMPFYAGWGLTVDQLVCSRRSQPRTLEQVFEAAYIQYARYVDPILNERCEIERIICYMGDQLVQLAQPELAVSLARLSRWKRLWIGDYLQTWNFQAEKRGQAMRWGRGEPEEPCFCVEDGFIRSVGLGVHFNRPVSLVCDRRGIYFDARVESDLEYMLNHRESTPWERWRAEQVIEQLRRANLTKYNVGQDTVLNLPEGRKIILVPGQVEGDASIRFGSPEVKTNEALLRAVRSAEPDAFIIYKPHPDVVAGQRDEGHWQGEFTTLADKVETDTSMATLLDQVDEVHTMTSLAGFEALLRRKQVTTYGMPFYAGWGLTRDNLRCERRVRQHDLASLVYFALIAYPTYLDPITRNACSAEQAIERVRQMKLGEVEVKDSKLQLLLLLKRVKHTGECWFNSTLNSFLRK